MYRLHDKAVLFLPPETVEPEALQQIQNTAFTMRDLDQAMTGIEYRRSDALLDEIPSAYKNIDEVMENARSLVRHPAHAESVPERQRRLTPVF